MIYERITKGFWGRYVFYLFVFVAVYFLTREKVDELVYGFGGGWLGEGEYTYITLLVLGVLWFYPLYRFLKDKRKPIVDAAHVAYVFIPVSVWYLIQLAFNSSEPAYWIVDNLFLVILDFTLLYSFILVVLWLDRPRIDHNIDSVLLKDEPINGDIDDEDKLGFTMYADSISSNIKAIAGNEKSYVFGIEGKWGSGKTSLINLVKARLKKHKEIHIVDFNPWMSNGSKQMTSDFFNRMTEEVSDLRLKAKFREYGKVLANVDGTGIIGKALDWLFPEPDLGTMLESINGCIKRQDLRFVVFIDDMDRLDKEELLAVLKMVRNTASFYQTVFVLMYDRDYVDAQLKVYFVDENVSSSYVDKIVNFQFDVPDSSSNFFRILKDKCNRLPVVLENPDIRLQDDDIPDQIKCYFDSYRKVKRVYNLLVAESYFPHFKKIPVKYMLVFFYISYYRKEEYEMIKRAYDIVNGGKWPRKKVNIGESKGTAMWRQIHESKGVYGVDTLDRGVEKKKEENAKRFENVILFKSDYPSMDMLLNGEGFNPFVKYLEFLFKLNAVHYKEFKEIYEQYGIDGYKGVEIKLFNAENILKRLIVIRDKFPKTFHEESVNEFLEMFTRGEKRKVEEADLQKYYEFLFGLLLNSSNPDNYLYIICQNIYGSKTELFFNTLNKVDHSFKVEDNYYNNYYKLFSEDVRQSLVTIAFNRILYFQRLNSSDSVQSNTEKEAIKHLEYLISKKTNYYLIHDAFIACSGKFKENHIVYFISAIPEEACRVFRNYIEQFPDEFVENCIKDHSQWEEIGKVSFHPFLLQIFNFNKDDIRKYFFSVVCKNRKGQFILIMIKKYLDKYLVIDTTTNSYVTFSISENDFDKIFNYIDMSDSEIKELKPFSFVDD